MAAHIDVLPAIAFLYLVGWQLERFSYDTPREHQIFGCVAKLFPVQRNDQFVAFRTLSCTMWWQSSPIWVPTWWDKMICTASRLSPRPWTLSYQRYSRYTTNTRLSSQSVLCRLIKWKRCYYLLHKYKLVVQQPLSTRPLGKESALTQLLQVWWHSFVRSPLSPERVHLHINYIRGLTRNLFHILEMLSVSMPTKTFPVDFAQNVELAQDVHQHTVSFNLSYITKYMFSSRLLARPSLPSPVWYGCLLMRILTSRSIDAFLSIPSCWEQ